MNYFLTLTSNFLSLFSIATFCSIAYADVNNITSPSGFNVYCTSNMDATGVCVNLKNQKSLNCLIIPGQLIDCRSSSGKNFQCVLFSQVTATQAEFYCNSQAELFFQDEVINNEAFTDVLSSS